MKLEDFNQIDPKNMGSLPLPVKAVILGGLFIMLVAAGYWLMWRPAMEELEQASQKEEKLRGVFMTKKKEAINLPIYKQQMVEIEQTFGTLLRQLPDKSQIDGLLTDINQAGLEVGLEFELFKPGQERRAEFYADKPISIKVIGSFYELGAFAQNIAKLSRIVKLENMTIAPGGKDGKLAVSAVARTFRYLDSSEMPAQTKSSKKNKKRSKKK